MSQAANARKQTPEELHLTRIAEEGVEHSELLPDEQLDVRYADGRPWAIFRWHRRGLRLVALNAAESPRASIAPHCTATRPLKLGETVGGGRMIRLGTDWLRVT